MNEILSMATLQKITGPISAGSNQEGNAASFLVAVNQYGDRFGLNRLHRLAELLGQVLLESDKFRYDRELWGPTPAQSRYDVRTDLGNTPERDGDGFRYRGRAGIQITGRANYLSFTKWVRAIIPGAPDFVKHPDLINTDPYEGLVVIWYWSTRKLNKLADTGNTLGITRSVNGGRNHFGRRQAWSDKAKLVFLGYDLNQVVDFQKENGLQVDGVIGEKTRAALFSDLLLQPPVGQLMVPSAGSGWVDWFLSYLARLRF